jgi:type IV pilus biogenesis protein CpaD/CtpE
MKKTILTVIALAALSGCASQDQKARSLLDRLEFGEDEIGCFRLNGSIDLNPMPVFTSNVNLSLVKKKGEAPDC